MSGIMLYAQSPPGIVGNLRSSCLAPDSWRTTRLTLTELEVSVCSVHLSFEIVSKYDQVTQQNRQLTVGNWKGVDLKSDIDRKQGYATEADNFDGQKAGFPELGN